MMVRSGSLTPLYMACAVCRCPTVMTLPVRREAQGLASATRPASTPQGLTPACPSRCSHNGAGERTLAQLALSSCKPSHMTRLQEALVGDIIKCCLLASMLLTSSKGPTSGTQLFHPLCSSHTLAASGREGRQG